MKFKKSYIIWIIFLITLAFRLYFAFQTQAFSSDDAYFHLRHSNYIKENLKPITYDELSYDGRYVSYPMLFHYFLVLFNFDPVLLKVIPEIFLAALVFIVYLFSKEMTKDENSSLFAAGISAFIPLYIRETINQISIYSLLLPVIFYMFYCLTKIEEKKYLNRFIILSFVLPLLHPTAFLFVLSLVFYYIFAVSEDIEFSKIKKEAIFFSCFLILLLEFLIYKIAFLNYGLAIIWQNIPLTLFAEYFKKTTLLQIIYNTGIIPLLFAGVTIFYGIRKEKKDSIFLLTSFILISLLLLGLKLLDSSISLMLVAIAAAILSGFAIKKFFSYLELTKIKKFKNIFIFIFFLFILFLLIIPSYTISTKVIRETPTQEDVETLIWLNKNARNYSVVLGNVYEGNMITALAERKNVIDSQFLLAPDPEQRLNDVETIYTTNLKAVATELIDKYKISYIYLSRKTKSLYNIIELNYYNENCFRQINDELYEVLC